MAIDVGSGSGRDSAVMSKMGFKTVGIDLSKQLLNKAKSLQPTLQFQYMDVRNLEFEDDSFGGVWCNAVLLHLNDEDLHKALNEINRVLVPKGIIAVSFKEGEGSHEVVEKFSSELARFYNFKSEDKLNQALRNTHFRVRQSHMLNERERFGPNKRDLNWVWSFAIKR